MDTAWIYMAMTNYPYPTKFLAPLPGWPVAESCKPFANVHDEQLNDEDRFKYLLRAARESISVYYNSTGQVKCFDLSGGETPDVDMSGWNALACNEMVMPMSTDGVNDMFLPQEWDEKAYTEMCENDYGLTPQYDWALTYFGGRQPELDFMYATNIVFANGDLDPWNAGSVMEEVSKRSVVVNIEDAAHHLDLRLPNEEDPESVVKARELEKSEIRKWLQEYNEKRSKSALA